MEMVQLFIIDDYTVVLLNNISLGVLIADVAATSVFKTHGRTSVKGFCFYIYIDIDLDLKSL
jgi:hypothetical protein